VSVAPIVRSVEIDRSPEHVFPLLVEPDSLRRWWPDVAELEPRVGGRIRMEFQQRQSVVVGEVTRYEPPKAIAFTWIRNERPDIATLVELTVTGLGGDRCRVDVVHSGWEQAPEWQPLHDAGWGHFLGCLAALAEGRPFDKSY
jgi:uncharacterized protein YndB with AHSA1/START domain